MDFKKLFYNLCNVCENYMERHSWLSFVLGCLLYAAAGNTTHTHGRAGKRFGNLLVIIIIIILFLFLIILVAYTENNYLIIRYLYRACFRIVVQKGFETYVSR